MAKISAVGSKLYAGGYDLSGDVSSLGLIESSVTLQDVTALESTAMERILLRRDAKMSFNAIFNPSAGHSHPVLSAFPSTEFEAFWAASATAGDIAAMIAAKQATYNPTIGADGSLLLAADFNGAVGAALEWGQIITAGKRQDTTATASGTGITLSLNGTESAITVTSASAANPTSVLTATAHGLVTGDSVVIAGSNKSGLNTDWTVTVVDATHFTVPLDLTSGAASGGTVTKTSSDTGWAAQLQVFSFTGTSCTVTIQDCESSSGTFANVAGGAFTAATGVTFQRLAAASPAILRKQVRVKTTGTFSECTFAVAIARL